MVNLSAAWDSNLYVCTKSYDWCVYVCVFVCACVIYRRITSNSSGGYVVNTPERDKRERGRGVCCHETHC